MINIKNEFGISLSVAFFGGIVVPLLYKDELGILTSIFFSLASFCLFYIFAIMPYLLRQENSNLENQYNPMYQMVVERKKAQVFVRYREDVKLWIGAAVFLLAVGIIGFAVVHFYFIY
jgi:hypothetical protein